jgi:RNA polymerase sigma-70 factor, ECF subfamily
VAQVRIDAQNVFLWKTAITASLEKLRFWLKGHKPALSDEELLRDFRRSGNKNLLGQLFDGHVETVYGVCLFYFREKEAARDAVMHVFEKLQQLLVKHEVKNFRAWLSCVTRNHCISELRKHKPGRLLPEIYLEFELRETTVEEEEIVAGVSEEQLLAHLAHCLPQLKEKQRTCIEAFYLNGRSYAEIVTETGYSLGEVKSCIQNGKRNLKLMIHQKITDEKKLQAGNKR